MTDFESTECGCNDCAKLRKEYDIKFGNLKKKIISTDLLLKKFSAKNAECVTLSKRFEDSSLLIECLQRDCTKCETELRRVLQEVEPLKKDNVRLSGEVETCRHQLSDFLSEIEAAKKSREQLTVKLQLCESREKKLRRQKDVAQEELKATLNELATIKKDDSAKKLCRKYKAAAKQIVKFGRKLHSSNLLTRQLSSVLARYEKELEVKNNDASSDGESDASTYQSDCESSGLRLEQNLLEDESDAQIIAQSNSNLSAMRFDVHDHLHRYTETETRAACKGATSDVCLSASRRATFVDGSNSPMHLQRDLLDTELLMDLASIFTTIVRPISPMPPSPKRFHRDFFEVPPSPSSNCVELVEEQDEGKSTNEEPNMKLTTVETESTPMAFTVQDVAQECSETLSEDPPIVERIDDVRAYSTDTSPLQIKSDDVVRLTIAVSSEEGGDNILLVSGCELNESMQLLFSENGEPLPNGVQECSTIAPQHPRDINEPDFVGLVSHDHTYPNLNEETIESATTPSATVESTTNDVEPTWSAIVPTDQSDTLLSSSAVAIQSVSSDVRMVAADKSIQTECFPDSGAVLTPPAELVKTSTKNIPPDPLISEKTLLNSSVRSLESPKRAMRHFRVESLPLLPQTPLVTFFKKGFVHDRVIDYRTFRQAASKSRTSFIKKGFLFENVECVMASPKSDGLISLTPTVSLPVATIDAGCRVSSKSDLALSDRSSATDEVDVSNELQCPGLKVTSKCPSESTTLFLSQYAMSNVARRCPIQSKASSVNSVSPVGLDGPSVSSSFSHVCQKAKIKKGSRKKSLRQTVFDSIKYKRRTRYDGVGTQPCGSVESVQKSVSVSPVLSVGEKRDVLPDVWSMFNEVILANALVRPISPLQGETTSKPPSVRPLKEFAFIRPMQRKQHKLLPQKRLQEDVNMGFAMDVDPRRKTLAERPYKRRKRPQSVAGDKGEAAVTNQIVCEGQLQQSVDDEMENEALESRRLEAIEDSPAFLDFETTSTVCDDEPPSRVDNVPESSTATVTNSEDDGALKDQDDGSWKMPNFLNVFVTPAQTDMSSVMNSGIIDSVHMKLKTASDDDPNSYERIADDICSSLSPSFLAALVKKLVTWMKFTLLSWLPQSVATLRFVSGDVRPALSPTESKCMKLVLVLKTKKDWTSIEDVMMETVHAELSKPRTKVERNVNYCSLCRFYVALCRHRSDLERARVLCYDFMFNTLDQCGPLIVSALAVCPTLLLVGGRTDSACLVEVMRFVLLNRRDRLGLPKAMNTADLFNNVCGFLLPDCDSRNLSTKLLDNFNRGEQDVSFETVKSLELLSKVEGWEWTNNFLIRRKLWPLLRQCCGCIADVRKDVADSTVAYCVYLLGCLTKQCPVENSISAREILKAMRGLLAKPPSLSRFQLCIQEAAVLAVIMLLPFNPVEGMVTLNNWIANNINCAASPEIIQIITIARSKYITSSAEPAKRNEVT